MEAQNTLLFVTKNDKMISKKSQKRGEGQDGRRKMGGDQGRCPEAGMAPHPGPERLPRGGKANRYAAGGAPRRPAGGPKPKGEGLLLQGDSI